MPMQMQHSPVVTSNEASHVSMISPRHVPARRDLVNQVVVVCGDQRNTQRDQRFDGVSVVRLQILERFAQPACQLAAAVLTKF